MPSVDRLAMIKRFYRKYNRLPSYSEMLRLFHFASKKAVHLVVHKWIEEGLLKIDSNKITPTLRFFGLPLFGMIKAGFPILAEEDRQYLTLDEYLINDPNSSFLLKVSGDSMINAGIFDGDVVVVEQKREPVPGDIVLAEIDREWTLKIYKKDRRHRLAYLEAANPKYPPFYPTQELKIHGVIGGVVRKLAN
ncbi:LexA family transcriptional regulator [Candidatus Roizmanbacteria bacterium]|nr:LexA family transcriptional regulator [Candidatus Roizmanbacteria bacterium]